MARGRTERAPVNWKPVGVTRVAGRTRRQMPKVRAPRLAGRLSRIALPLTILAALAVGGWWLYSSPLLSVQDVKIEGNAVVPAELARGVAGLDGQSIFQTDLTGAKERLMALPVVKGVKIDRDWPNGVRITIVERAAWGFWQLGNARYVIDDEGVVLDLPAPVAAPVIVQNDTAGGALSVGERVDSGAMAVATQLVATAEQTLGRRVQALQFSKASGLTAVLSDAGGSALNAVFGDAQGYEFKVAALFAVLKQAQQEGRTLSRVDLRFGDRVAVE